MMKKFDRASVRIARDFRAIIADSEDLLKAAATGSGEGFTAARARFEERLSGAKAMLAEAAQPAERYMRGNPWTAVGIAVAAGALIGLLAARR